VTSGTLDRLASALSDRYRIERELGAGGMATVYLAHDLRHDRPVAIKVLHPELGAALGGERFLSEIKTTAKLQHPHILPLLDSGEAGGLLFYVMPYVSGETLRARLERETQLPIADAVRIARETADALNAAHALGIVHRDIKPENILLQGGHALVADFGIALAVQHAGGQRMTQTGLSLGTPQYMSPEQAMGEKNVDARADVYALGAVTYEMLTGEPPFTGSTVQAIVAKLMTDPPRPLTELRKSVPPNVEAAVLAALEKLPADRIASAAEFAAALGSDAPFRSTRGTSVSVNARSSAKRASAIIAALALTTGTALVVAAWALATRSSAVPASLVGLFDIVLPDSAAMTRVSPVSATGFGTSISHLSVSPAGDFVVYPSQRGDSTILWYKSLVDGSAHAIPGTAEGAAPRISPDGRRIAFIAGGRTLVVPVAGGEPRRLMDGDPPASLEWVSSTRLLAAGNDGYGMKWIDPEVGVVEDRQRAGGRCVFGQWIAEDRHLLCGFFETATMVDPESGEMHPIRTRAADRSPGAPVSGSAFRLVDGAYMMYVSLDGNLRAASYDRGARLLGRSVTLATGVSRDAVGAAQLDLSPSGLLGFVPASGGADAQLVVLREGAAPVPLPIERAPFLRFDLSPDRRRLAAVVAVPEGEELRVYDLRTGRRQSWMGGSRISMPLWSPSGDRLLVRVETSTRIALLSGSPTATAAPDTVMSSDNGGPVHDALDFFDDRTILARDTRGAGVYQIDISARPVKIDTLLTDAYFTTVSPDRKLLAWQNALANQVFVGAYPLGAKRQQIGSGAVEPVWLSPTELVYRSHVTWYKVRIDPASGEAGAPTLWARDMRFLDTPGWSNRSSRDGGILYSQSLPQADVRYLRFIPDFVQRMKRAVDEANR
jgi:serine/threonine-protein kinase